MRRTGHPAPVSAAIARNVRAYDAAKSTDDALHRGVLNPVEQARPAVAVRDVRLAAWARARDTSGSLLHGCDSLPARHDCVIGERCLDRKGVGHRCVGCQP